MFYIFLIYFGILGNVIELHNMLYIVEGSFRYHIIQKNNIYRKRLDESTSIHQIHSYYIRRMPYAGIDLIAISIYHWSTIHC